jgi:Tfp pilus assembly protein PilF
MPRVTAPLLVLALLLSLGLPGCWRVTGSRVQATPEQTLALALDARRRGDARACQTYLRRLLKQAPESPQATLARALLLGAPTEDPGLTVPTRPYEPSAR